MLLSSTNKPLYCLFFLSNPKREYIPVTDQFLNEDYINWNNKAGNVGISGRNYPDGYELEELLNQQKNNYFWLFVIKIWNKSMFLFL